ncbi:MAG: hypothetical protein QNL04_10170 [SAR324 cluster bacterium]|nr:hypothetical protein [SAR324 cluster bacterium]
MPTKNRLNKVNGNLNEKAFLKVTKQIEGRGVVVVAMVNRTCAECDKIQLFVKKLESGWLKKLPNLVFFYGYNETTVDKQVDDNGRPIPAKKSSEKALGDSNIFNWPLLPDGHGYAIYTSPTDVTTCTDDFNHAEFETIIIDTLRRFNSSIRTLPNMGARKKFIDGGGTGIVVETSGNTKPSKIHDCENQIKAYGEKLRIPIYFLKGLGENMTYYINGKPMVKLAGLNFDKLLKKVPA